MTLIDTLRYAGFFFLALSVVGYVVAMARFRRPGVPALGLHLVLSMKLLPQYLEPAGLRWMWVCCGFGAVAGVLLAASIGLRA